MAKQNSKAEVLNIIDEIDNCKYCLDSKGYSYIDQDGVSLKVMHLNIRSLSKNMDSLLLLLDDLAQKNIVIDVILLCETYLNSTSKTVLKIPGYTNYHKCRENSLGGGVSVFVTNSLTVLEECTTAFTDIFESLFVKLKVANKEIYVGEVYRVPNTNMNNFVAELTNMIKDFKSKNIIIGTDQNINLLHTDKFKPARDYLEMMLENKFLPCINLPTRVTFTTSTLIDNIYMRMKSYISVKSLVLKSDISDHYPCISSVLLNSNLPKGNQCVSTETRILSDDAKSKINHFLLHYDWTCTLQKMYI